MVQTSAIKGLFGSSTRYDKVKFQMYVSGNEVFEIGETCNFHNFHPINFKIPRK